MNYNQRARNKIILKAVTSLYNLARNDPKKDPLYHQTEHVYALPKLKLLSNMA
jgi:hypothetical protein